MEDEIKITETVYCNVCTLPVQFCQFTKTFEECKKALKKQNSEAFAELYPEEVEEECSEESSEASETVAVDHTKKHKITIQKAIRSKTKGCTYIEYLQDYDIDLKEFSQKAKKKFGCGSGLIKFETLPTKYQEVVEIQGDIRDQIIEWIGKEYGISADNITTGGDVKKKGRSKKQVKHEAPKIVKQPKVRPPAKK